MKICEKSADGYTKTVFPFHLQATPGDLKAVVSRVKGKRRPESKCLKNSFLLSSPKNDRNMQVRPTSVAPVKLGYAKASQKVIYETSSLPIHEIREANCIEKRERN